MLNRYVRGKKKQTAVHCLLEVKKKPLNKRNDKEGNREHHCATVYSLLTRWMLHAVLVPAGTSRVKLKKPTKNGTEMIKIWNCIQVTENKYTMIFHHDRGNLRGAFTRALQNHEWPGDGSWGLTVHCPFQNNKVRSSDLVRRSQALRQPKEDSLPHSR